MNPSLIEIVATAAFALAVLHTFLVSQIAKFAHRFPEGSIAENLLHFLAEPEIVFGLWAAALFLCIAMLKGSILEAAHYVEGLNFTEAKFVFVVMVIAATRPIVSTAGKILHGVSRVVPLPPQLAFFVTALAVGPLLGSIVTEPAAMTLLALILKQRYFDREVSPRFAYSVLGLLFVNVSVGGTLTHFAAPPVLMVARKWEWDSWFMLTHFGWRAVLSCVLSTAIVAIVFRRDLMAIEPPRVESRPVPWWLTLLHALFLGAAVLLSHYPDVVLGVFMLFLGLATATREYQDRLKLREALLVGFFLAGLVTLGSLQEYWLKPLITGLNGSALFFGAMALTAITDNAALTYLGSLVEGIAPDLQYALVAGAVTGGGLTIIANAPNPAGAGILSGSRAFGTSGISPVGLLLGALLPTLVAAGCFWGV